MDELVGYLKEEGYSEGEIDEMISPMDAYEGRAVADSLPPGTGGGGVHDAVRAVLVGARDKRKPPGRQKAVAPGTAVPADKDAKAVRVDTEESYREFRGAAVDDEPGDLPDASEDWTEALERLQREVTDEQVVGFGERGSAADIYGDVGPRGDQACLLCGRQGAGSAACAACRARHAQLIQAVIGFGERGPASEIYGMFERGYASEIIGYTARQMELLGYTARQMELIGYTARQMELLGNVAALEVPSTVHAEEIPLSFANPEDARHIATWKAGPNLYSSIRLAGWDGHPRILTATTPYGKSLGIVVGIAEQATVPPAHTMAILDPLARQLGASELIPRLAAAAPAVLRVAHGKSAPLITAAYPAR